MIDERFETISYYMKTKRYAISKMTKFVKPLDDMQLEEMQIIYSIYFNSFISLIDYICEILDNTIYDHCNNILGSETNFKYVRELRNSIIHRGLDVSMAGCELEGFNIIVPFAPKVVYNRKGEIEYQNFTDNLFQLVVLCEQVNPYIHKLCSDMNLLRYDIITKEEILERSLNDPYIPEFAKELLKQAKIDYNELNRMGKQIHEDKIKKYFDTQDLFPKINEV
ncbi:hypothetical protein J6A34_01415 [bacterium]|nr:hypothetical protein [bacterium]